MVAQNLWRVVKQSIECLCLFNSYSYYSTKAAILNTLVNPQTKLGTIVLDPTNHKH